MAEAKPLKDKRRYLKTIRDQKATITADRQQIEILKTDLHIANRALEIHPHTVELRKQVVADRIELKKITEDRDLLEKGLDSAMRQVSSLNQGNIADSKQIEELEEDAKLDDAIIETGKAVIKDKDKTIADQTAEIEELRGIAREYGQHKSDCLTTKGTPDGIHADEYCTCDWTSIVCHGIARQALDAGKEQEK